MPDLIMQPRQTAPVSISGNSTGRVDLLPYFTVGALSVHVWDILSELRRDVRLLRSVRGRGLRGSPYVLARLTTLAFCVSSAIFQVTPLSIATGCTQTHTALTTLYALSLSSTYLLVFFRIRSAFQRDGYISLLFGVLWLLVVGAVGSMVYGTSFSVSENGGLYGNANDTNSTPCLGFERQIVKGYAFIALLGPLLYISLVYMFQSARFVTHGNGFGHSRSHTGSDSDSDSEVWRDGFMVDGLREMRFKDLVKVFVKGLLSDGQGHYLFMILVQLVSFIFFLSSGPTQPQSQVQIASSQSNSTTRFILLVPSTVITNIMVCKVYRDTLTLEFKCQELGGKIKHQFLKEMERETCRHEVPLQLAYLNVDVNGKSPTQINCLNHGTHGGHGGNARIWMGAPAGASSSSQSVGGIMVTHTVEKF